MTAAATDRIVIVGASLAGGTAAKELREQGFTGEILLLGKEPHTPYERPPLSKQFMQGKAEGPDWVLGEGEAALWAERDVQLRTGVTVTAIDPDAHVVRTAEGGSERYDWLILATGAEPKVPQIPGIHTSGVNYLRTFSDAQRLREQVKSVQRAVILGASWIGTEVAASIREHGVEVEVVDSGSKVLPGLQSQAVSDRIAALHRDHDVTLTLNSGIDEVLGSGSVEAVRIGDRRVETQLLLVAVGVSPDLTLARSAGLAEAQKGIRVSATFASSAERILAIGDCAALDHALYGQPLRVEHWDVAQQHGKAVARVLLGDKTPYDRVPFFFSDQYDLGFEYRGWVSPLASAEVVLRGNDPAGEWFVFWLVDGRIQAVMNVNAWDDSTALWQLAEQRPRVDPNRLRDPAVPIGDLLS